MTNTMAKPKLNQTLIVGVFLYAFLLAAYLITNSLLKESAIYPWIIITLFTFLNTMMVIDSFRKKSKVSGITVKEIKMPLLYFAGIVLYALLFSWTNYFVATGIMLVAYMLILKVRPIWMIPIIVVGYGTFVYFLFAVWLRTSII